MNVKEFINDFDVLLLDMGNTFMFNCNHFTDSDINLLMNKKQLNNNKNIIQLIHYLHDNLLKIGREEKNFENFPTINEFINNDDNLKNLTNNEKNILEYLFACLEMGEIPDKYKNIIQELSKKFELGLISNIWSKSSYYKKYLTEIDILKFFKVTVFSSDYMIIKPSKKIFEIAFNYFKKENKNYVYIGNNYKRDIIGSKNAGIYSILINNGKDSEITGEIKPDFIINDLEELL